MTTIALCTIATVSYKKTKQKYYTPLCIACLDIDAVAQKQYLITYALLSDNHRTDIQYWLLSCTLIRSIFETNVLKLLCDSLTSLCLTGHTHTTLFILICDFFTYFRPEFGREKLPLHKKTTDPRHPEDREVDFERANVLHQKVSLAVPACGFARYGQLKTVNISPSGCEKVEGHKVLSSQDFLRQLTKSETEIHEIEQKTITQSDCALWYEERKIRLTASNFHSVAMRRTSSNPEVLAERLLVGLTKKTKAMKFGLEKEQSAAERYIEKMKKDGKNVTVKSCGFRISKSHPFLGASADRLASDEEGGLVLVEIKKSIIYMDL